MPKFLLLPHITINLGRKLWISVYRGQDEEAINIQLKIPLTFNNYILKCISQRFLIIQLGQVKWVTKHRKRFDHVPPLPIQTWSGIKEKWDPYFENPCLLQAKICLKCYKEKYSNPDTEMPDK